MVRGTQLKGAAYTYTIEKILGQGTFGITYLATSKVQIDGALGALETTLTVAIKEFFMHDLNGRRGNEVTCSSQGGIYEHYRRKFAREAQNLSKLRHPNIVRVLESFEANNTVYYAMEFCEGGSLDELIAAQGGLSEAVALEYARQIGSALDYMHGEKILHLDLKPGNVMLRKNGSVALIDFGLSKQYDEEGAPESSTTIGGGTPGYAPIEQANYREGGQFAAAIDVYALGATLFKMLTGERPAEASVLLNEGFPAEKLTAKGVSEQTTAVVAKAMEGLKRNRYATVAEFLKALDGTAATPPVAPAPEEKTVFNDPAAEATVIDEAPKPAPAPKPASAPQPKPQPAPVSAPPKKKGSKKGLWISLIAVLGCILIGGAVYLWEPWVERVEVSNPTGFHNGYGFVDLGLSVKWATNNVQEPGIVEIGDYYAWGETASKNTYSTTNYTYQYESLYIGNQIYDVAFTQQGGNWRMPTNEQWQELIDQCTWIWVYHQGHKGYKIVGPNKNSIFLPAAGDCSESSLRGIEQSGRYWSSTTYDTISNERNSAYTVEFFEDIQPPILGGFPRYYGCSVRPVIADITAEPTPATSQFNDVDSVANEGPLAVDEIATEKANQERLAAEKAAKEKAEKERREREDSEKAEQQRITQMVEAGKGRDGVYKVGDYYNVNGKEGVVFYVDDTGRHGKIVSMTQSSQGLQWSSNVSEQKRLIGASSEMNGATNMRAIQQRPNWRANYPAFAWCAKLGAGWYLPAIEELKLFTLDNSIHDTVNRTLSIKRGTKLYNKGEVRSYWSSTEHDYQYNSDDFLERGKFCAWCVGVYKSYTSYNNKDIGNHVRAVSAF